MMFSVSDVQNTLKCSLLIHTGFYIVVVSALKLRIVV